MKTIIEPIYNMLKPEDWNSVEVHAKVIGREMGEYCVKTHSYGILLSHGPELTTIFEKDIVERVRNMFSGSVVKFWIPVIKIYLTTGEIIESVLPEPELKLPIEEVEKSTALEYPVWHKSFMFNDSSAKLTLTVFPGGRVECVAVSGDDLDQTHEGWTVHIHHGDWWYDSKISDSKATFEFPLVHDTIDLFFNDQLHRIHFINYKRT